MTLYKGNKVIAGSRSYIGNIGDIKYTTRVDLPFGGSWCDGSIKLKAQFPTVYQMLIDGKLQALDIATYESALNLNGSCGFFGLDTATESFRVPSLNDVYIKSGQVADEFGAESLPNIKGSVKSNIGESNNSSSDSALYTENQRGHAAWQGSVTVSRMNDLSLDASRSSSAYQDGAKVNPDHVKYRAYVVLYTGADTNIDITKEIQLNNPFFFGMSQYFEVDPKNASWLKSDGAFHSGAVYESFYNWLVSEYENPDMLPNKVNTDIKGSLSESNGVFTGFADTNYLYFNLDPVDLSDLFEIVISFNTGTWSDTSAKACGVLGGDSFPQIQIYNQQANIASTSGRGTYTYSANENVIWKIQIQNGVGNIYRLDSLTNEFVFDYTFSFASQLSGNVTLGRLASNRFLADGSINLHNTYVAINGQVWWKGVDNAVRKPTESYSDYDYIINTESNSFRLPVKTHLASGNAVCGNGMSLGLTNGKYNAGLSQKTDGGASYGLRADTSVYGSSLSTNQPPTTTASGTFGVTTDPQYSGIETSSQGLMLYFYVGDVVSDANLLNAGKVLDLLAKLESYDCVVERQDGSTDLYIWYTERYKSGYVRQYFLFPQKSSYSMQTIKMPIPMANTDYIAVPSVSGYDSSTSIAFTHMSIVNKTTTTFQTKNDNAFVKQVIIYGKAA